MASAAAASSNYTASASAGTSNYGSATTFNDNKFPKFSEYRSRVCPKGLFFVEYFLMDYVFI